MGRKSAAKISRNKKKYWRKGVDVGEVTAFLERQRRERLAEEHWKDVTNGHALFQLDKKPGGKGRFALPQRQAPVEQLRPTPRYLAKRIEKLAKAVSQGRVELTAPTKRQAKRCRTPAFYDIWDAREAPDARRTVVGLEDDDTLKEYYLKGMKKVAPKPAPTLRLPCTSRKSVDLPHPGTSYNPSAQDHQALIDKVYNEEVQRLAEEARIRHALRIPDHETAATEESDRLEMLQGLIDDDDDDDDDGLDGANPMPAEVNHKKTMTKLKTKAQRHREARAKLRQQMAAERKKKRISDNQIFRLRSIKREIALAEERSRLKRERRLERQRKKLQGPLRLGPHKFEPPGQELLLPDSLPDSLRRLEAQGSILMDRYKSFQQRNVIEPRYRVTKTKKFNAKVKERAVARLVDADYIPDNPLSV